MKNELSSFIETHCQRAPDLQEPKKSFYAAYCAESSPHLTANSVGREMAARGFREVRKGDTRFWQGIALSPANPQPQALENLTIAAPDSPNSLTRTSEFLSVDADEPFIHAHSDSAIDQALRRAMGL